MSKSSDVGALSRIGAAEVAAAAGLARAGRVYDLGMELSTGTPDVGLKYSRPFSLIQCRVPEESTSDPDYRGYSFSSDAVTSAIHNSSHIDGLVHGQYHMKTYGGHRAADLLTDEGWTRYGAETIPPIVGRGVLLDIAGLHEVDRLEDGYEVSIADCERAFARQGVALRSGDAVLFRTGKITQFGTDNAAFQAGEPGPAMAAAAWLYDQGMVVLGADNHGVEAIPFPDADNTVHKGMLVDRGVHLLENLYLEELARDRVYEFLFVCLPLKIVGATGSWIRPVAIV